MPSKFETSISILIPLQLTYLTSYIYNTNDGNKSPPSYTILFFLYLFLDASYSQFFHTIIFLPATRYIACHLPGADVPPWEDEGGWLRQEEEMNDVSIVWPKKEDLMKLPSGWVVNLSAADDRQKKTARVKEDVQSKDVKQHNQPYYLNHVRGSTRIRQAAQRIAAALGTVCSSYVLCYYASFICLKDVGLDIMSRYVAFDLCCGFFVGAFIVSFIFVVELMLGWVRIIGYFESVECQEKFIINFTWDILFHVGVSINEEVMLRGWMFVLSTRGILTTWFDDLGTSATFAIIMSTVLQSTLFALMHFNSPGSTSVSLINLFIGGIAASFNFLVAGGTLWLGVGWHFGWNIMMGHVLGRSTSGIPMSCSVLNVVPRPELNGISYEKFHGGMFGPEQGILAPLAYLMGMCMVVSVYGWDGLVEFRSSTTLLQST